MENKNNSAEDKADKACLKAAKENGILESDFSLSKDTDTGFWWANLKATSFVIFGIGEGVHDFEPVTDDESKKRALRQAMIRTGKALLNPRLKDKLLFDIKSNRS
jgi:hypothetical protein